MPRTGICGWGAGDSDRCIALLTPVGEEFSFLVGVRCFSRGVRGYNCFVFLGLPVHK